MFEPKATKEELMQLKAEQSKMFDEHNERLHTEFRQSVTSIKAMICDEVTKLRTENSTLRAELAALKDGKQPKVADSMPEIVSHENYYRVTFRDENGSIKAQVEVTPDSMPVTADKITLNGADISSAQI